MRRTAVDSTAIRSMGYDASRRELDVEFRESGDVYRYLDVSPDEYAEFVAAESKGTHLNQVIKVRHRFIAMKRKRSRYGPGRETTPH